MKPFIVILLMLFSISLPVISSENADIPVLPSQIGRVESIETFENLKNPLSGESNYLRQSVEVKVLTGAYKGEKVIIDNMLMGNPAYDINLKKGNKVVLHAEQNNGGSWNFFIADIERVNVLYFLTGLFFAALLIIGKKKGFFSLISILIILGLIFCFLTPLILIGVNPVLAAVIICALASVAAIYLVGGINSKSSAAVLGTILSLLTAGILSVLTIKFASLTGFSSEESMFLFSAYPNLNFKGVLASAMIIGALGAVMDIGMSISSTINELFISNNSLKIKELFTSGMNVGKDIIGTMANTLILAYLGGSLPLVLLSGNIDLQKFFNLNQVATEISSALIGSTAIVLCVPITAIIAAYLIKKSSSKTIEENNFSDIIKL